MRTWFALLIVAVGAIWIIVKPAPREIVGAAVDREWSRVFEHEHLDMSARVTGWADSLLEGALDPAASITDRLGDTELFVLHAISRGSAPRLEDAFEDATLLATEVAYGCGEEPAFAALALDALRAHRFPLGKDRILAADSRAAADELVRWGRRVDPDNGLFLVFAAEVALEEDREQEARDLVVAASRCRFVDAYRSARLDASERALLRRGAPLLEARKYLFGEYQGTSDFGVGAMLDNLAVDLARRLGDASEAERLRLWVAISELGCAVAPTSMWADDARAALGAEGSFIGAARPGVPDRLRSEGQSAALVARFEAAGLAGAHAVIERGIAFQRQFLNKLNQRALKPGKLPKKSRDVALLTAGNGLAIGCAMVALIVALLLSAVARPWSKEGPSPSTSPSGPPKRGGARRREAVNAISAPTRSAARSTAALRPRSPIRAPSAPTGLYVASAASPALLVLYLLSKQIGPFTDLAAAIESPSPWLIALPLVSLVVFTIPCLGDRRLRSPGVLLRELACLSLLVAGVCLILFAWSADQVVAERAGLLRMLAELRVDRVISGP